jgi:hypothetical protein
MLFQDNTTTGSIYMKYSMNKTSTPVGIDLVMSIPVEKMFYLRKNL